MAIRAPLTVIVLLFAAAGCAPASSAPNRPTTWYIGTRGGNDYFHEGRTPQDGRNYRLPRGHLDLGVSFPLTFDATQWRPVEIVQPDTRPAPSTAPAGDSDAG